ncbi:MAG: TIGR02587 family membrane protein [Gemmatimonadales bacterium]|nr:TIGR02587 family membrane protein [Gemmatimonadales bacterium]
MPQARSTPAARSPAESLREFGRGIAGGLLFSLPLLYTMEVWDAGITLPPHRQLVYLAGTSVLLLGYNRYAGLHPESSWAEVVIDSVEELGIGLVLSAIILFVLGRIPLDQPLHEVLGPIVVEAMTIAIGVSVGTAQLGGDEDRGVDTRQIGLGGHLALAACGAVLFAANVAPTEEIVMLGLELAAGRLLLLALLSVALAGLILFFSDFRGSRRWAGADGWVGVTRGIVITYAVGLVSSALILWLFGRFDGAPLSAVVGQTVTLGVAATMGASAGRLLLLQ